MRASRTIRHRLRKKLTPDPGIAKTIEINDEGLAINGTQLPIFTGTDFTVDHYDDDLKLVTLSIYTEAFTITSPPHIHRATITERHHPQG